VSAQAPLLIAGGTLVSKDHARQPGDVLVDGERIASVAPRIRSGRAGGGSMPPVRSSPPAS